MTKEQMAAYDAQQRANADMSAEDRAAASRAQGFIGRGGIKDPTASVGTTPEVPRNLDAEAATVKRIGVTPTNESEQAEMILATYGDKIPTEFQDLMDRYNALQGTGDQAGLTQLGKDITAAGQNAAAFQGAVEAQAGQIPGELGILQNALKMKSGVGAQPLGESDIFKQAGVGGYGALSSSLAAHGQEMDFKYTSFANMVNQAAKFQYGENSKYAAQAKAALDQFSILQDSYRYEQSRLDDIAARAEAVQNELYTYGEKLKMDAAYEAARNSTTELGGNGQITTSQAQTIFNIVPTGKYSNGSQYHKGEKGWELGTNTWECGEGFNQITDGPRAGSTLAEKLAMRDLSITSPSIGNGLVLPLGEDTGHIETVISNNNGLIQTVSWNRNLDGQQTIQTYTIDELNSKYGKNWGFTNSTLKPEYEAALANASSGVSPDSITPSQIAQFNEYFTSGGKTIPPAYKGNEEAFARRADQFKAMTTDPSVGLSEVLSYSVGRKELTSTAVEALGKNILTSQQLTDLTTSLEDLDEKDFGPLLGIISGANPYNEKAQLIKAQLQSIVPNLARGVYGEVGVLTDADIANYMKTIPNLTSTEDLRNAVLEMTKRTIGRSLETKLRTYAGTYDVSGYQFIVNDYGLDQPAPEVEQEDPLVVEYKESEKANDPNYQEALAYYNGNPPSNPPSNPFNPFAGSSIKHSKSK